METSSIEKLDELKYKSMIWITIGFSLSFGSMILNELLEKKSFPL